MDWSQQGGPLPEGTGVPLKTHLPSPSPSLVAATKATRYTSRMSSKDKILSVIQALPEDVSVDEAIDRLYLLSKIERGIREADAGDVVDHDAVMNELLDDET